jgi:hypothetical protein
MGNVDSKYTIYTFYEEKNNDITSRTQLYDVLIEIIDRYFPKVLSKLCISYLWIKFEYKIWKQIHIKKDVRADFFVINRQLIFFESDYKLKIISTSDGQVIKTVPINLVSAYPVCAWSSNDNLLLLVHNNNKGDISTLSMEEYKITALCHALKIMDCDHEWYLPLILSTAIISQKLYIITLTMIYIYDMITGNTINLRNDEHYHFCLQHDGILYKFINLHFNCIMKFNNKKIVLPVNFVNNAVVIQNNIYVCDSLRHTICRIDLKKEKCYDINIYGSHIATDGRYLYVHHEDNVNVYDSCYMVT